MSEKVGIAGEIAAVEHGKQFVECGRAVRSRGSETGCAAARSNLVGAGIGFCGNLGRCSLVLLDDVVALALRDNLFDVSEFVPGH